MTGTSEDRAHRFEVRPTASDHFAWLRTRLSIERTMMAWVRTAVALIGFGFTIVQFFDRLGSIAGAAPPRFPEAPRYLGLMLISCGIGSLVISIWQYHAGVRYLRSGDFGVIAGIEAGPKTMPVLWVSFALIFVGLFAFFAVLLRFL
jgi:putative membrane protein